MIRHRHALRLPFTLSTLGLLCLGGFLACQPPPTEVASTDEATSAFHQLLADHWERAQEERIYFRTDPDGWRMEGRLSEHTPAARARRHEFNESVLVRLAEIDPGELGEADRVSYRVFEYEREAERDSYSQFDHRFPFTSLFGYHTYFAEAPANMSFLDAAAYEDYLVSLEDFPRYNGELIESLREAIGAGYTHYCESIQDYGVTIDLHIVEDPRESLLFGPFEEFPATVGEAQRQEFTARGLQLIEERVIPGYETLYRFFVDEYLPNCRNTVGIASLPEGDAYYRYLIRYFTTTDLSPQEIHDLGLSEVARIRGEMEEIIRQVEFEGGFREFLDYLRQEPSFYAKTELELLGRAALIAKTAEGELPKFFGLLPRGTYKIKPNPNRGTFYMGSAGDGKTSGTYFLSTGDLSAEPLYSLEALTLHEGVPGHHLQGALSLELDLPEFRKTLYHGAYGEGWGLYSEWLGKEMGFYQDPYSDFGRLTYEAWRATRLVVDTGMHAFGWSRQQALDYMLDHTAASRVEADREIDRYITWPAQALSYKIGELEIRKLRSMAEAELGTDFDLRGFHDTVVGNGSLPIEVLQDLVAEWVEAERQARGR